MPCDFTAVETAIRPTLIAVTEDRFCIIMPEDTHCSRHTKDKGDAFKKYEKRRAFSVEPSLNSILLFIKFKTF